MSRDAAPRLGFRRALRVVVAVTALNLRARLAYRGEFLLALLNGVLWQGAVLLFMTVLVSRFSTLGGWTSREVLFLAGFRLLAHAVYVCVFLNVSYLPQLVREGRVDAFLMRPMPLLTQVLLNGFNVNALGDLLVAGTLFTVAVDAADPDWNPWRLGFLAAALAGAVLLEAAVQLTVSSFAFRQAETLTLAAWLDELMASFGNYPLTIFPTALRVLFAGVVPIAYIAYLPSQVILGRAGGLSPGSLLAYASPLVGVAAFLAARRLWYSAARRYEGVGG
ncbi:ABC-2 family transporter protein [Actinomadura graeca]|uniref:ABC-2 family transporter protein n=1 Tax=Actinomadura graeca TaxID=2750812 RepID=A0ABX8QWD7_9ACTN|nr:ABC-2 family transporter protein [Actinomadura graeca]QXJ22299.1 ABC-2 family transporter protein [Actinomadura graeca]